MNTREALLGFASSAILARAIADGYPPDAYDPESDDEGYITSLLIALRHWCAAHGHDWTAELSRAQGFFEEDLRETQAHLDADPSG